jgi:hypothetical protein
MRRLLLVTILVLTCAAAASAQTLSSGTATTPGFVKPKPPQIQYYPPTERVPSGYLAGPHGRAVYVYRPVAKLPYVPPSNVTASPAYAYGAQQPMPYDYYLRYYTTAQRPYSYYLYEYRGP